MFYYKVTATGTDKEGNTDTVHYFTDSFHGAENLKAALEHTYIVTVTIEEKEGQVGILN